MKKLLLLFLVIGFFSFRASAQLSFDGKTVSGTVTGLSFQNFVKVIEKNSEYYFYYNQADTDSVFVTASVTKKSLPAFLNQLFYPCPEKADLKILTCLFKSAFSGHGFKIRH